MKVIIEKGDNFEYAKKQTQRILARIILSKINESNISAKSPPRNL
jgi:hypothetical protein